MRRRDFIRTVASGVALSALPAFAKKKGAEIWAGFLPFGRNMWSDVPVPRWGMNDGDTEEKRKKLEGVCAADHVRFDAGSFRRITEKMASIGMNMVVIDIGEALNYPSHPEIHVKGGWSPERFRDELARLRNLGLEPVPKLNFSTSHDAWLGVYHRMVSTPKYYEVCRDLINDVCDIFDGPSLFHLGYDEESASLQKYYGYCVVRQGDLWWHDFDYISGLVEKRGVRPWIWSDYYWHHPEDFVKRMSKGVLQSNWYYGGSFDYEDPYMGEYASRAIKAYLALEKAGFDQVPCGSDYLSPKNMPATVRFCRKHLAPERLKGFLIAPWHGACLPQNEAKFISAMDCMSAAIAV